MLSPATPITKETMNAAVKRPTETVFVPAGSYTVRGFGPATQDAVVPPAPDHNDLGTCIIKGEGRETKFFLDPSENAYGFFPCRNEVDWHDGQLRDMAFFGNGNPHGLVMLDLSCYSNMFDGLFIRAGDAGENTHRGTGIKLRNGQDNSFLKIQSEGHAIGVHLESERCFTALAINAESCDVGVLIENLLDDNHGKPITIGTIYAEDTDVALRIVGNCKVNLTGGIDGTGDNSSVELIGASECTLNLVGSHGNVVMDKGSHGNEIIVSSMSGKVRVTDNGIMNRVRTAALPVVLGGELLMWDKIVEPVDDSGNRFNFDMGMVASGEDEVINIRYSTTKQADLFVELYDKTTGRLDNRFDFKSRTWVDSSRTVAIPWVTNQECLSSIPFNTGNESRDVQFRFWYKRAAGSKIKVCNPVFK